MTRLVFLVMGIVMGFVCYGGGYMDGRERGERDGWELHRKYINALERQQPAPEPICNKAFVHMSKNEFDVAMADLEKNVWPQWFEATQRLNKGLRELQEEGPDFMPYVEE